MPEPVPVHMILDLLSVRHLNVTNQLCQNWSHTISCQSLIRRCPSSLGSIHTFGEDYGYILQVFPRLYRVNVSILSSLTAMDMFNLVCSNQWSAIMARHDVHCHLIGPMSVSGWCTVYLLSLGQSHDQARHCQYCRCHPTMHTVRCLRSVSTCILSESPEWSIRPYIRSTRPYIKKLFCQSIVIHLKNQYLFRTMNK